MRFEVPQYIDVEDKIFGPLSWRQFLYLGGGIGMGVALFLTTNWFIFFLVGLPISVLAGALAFYPINNRPFSFFLEAIVVYFKSNHLYLWRQKTDLVKHERVSRKPGGGEMKRASENKNISSLARRLELQALQKDK